MIPVFQTKFTTFGQDGEKVTRGNCTSACLASIMELRLSEVPDSSKSSVFKEQRKEINELLGKQGKKLRYTTDPRDVPLNTYVVVGGVSPRCKCVLSCDISSPEHKIHPDHRHLYHSCVGFKDGESKNILLLHDPYPLPITQCEWGRYKVPLDTGNWGLYIDETFEWIGDLVEKTND